MQKYYKAEMDRLLRVTTRVIWLFFIVPPGFLLFAWYQALHPAAGGRPMPAYLAWLLPASAAFLALTAYITRAMAPRGYAVNDIELVIDRAMRPITIPLREIKEVKPLEDGVLMRSARLMGTSGFYGHYGLFWSKKTGKFRAYATRMDRLVAVRTEKTLFVLSPENPEDFAAALRGLLR